MALSWLKIRSNDLAFLLQKPQMQSCGTRSCLSVLVRRGSPWLQLILQLGRFADRLKRQTWQPS